MLTMRSQRRTKPFAEEEPAGCAMLPAIVGSHTFNDGILEARSQRRTKPFEEEEPAGCAMLPAVVGNHTFNDGILKARSQRRTKPFEEEEPAGCAMLPAIDGNHTERRRHAHDAQKAANEPFTREEPDRLRDDARHCWQPYGNGGIMLTLRSQRRTKPFANEEPAGELLRNGSHGCNLQPVFFARGTRAPAVEDG